MIAAVMKKTNATAISDFLIFISSSFAEGRRGMHSVCPPPPRASKALESKRQCTDIKASMGEREPILGFNSVILYQV